MPSKVSRRTMYFCSRCLLRQELWCGLKQMDCSGRLAVGGGGGGGEPVGEVVLVIISTITKHFI